MNSLGGKKSTENKFVQVKKKKKSEDLVPNGKNLYLVFEGWVTVKNGELGRVQNCICRLCVGTNKGFLLEKE